MSKIMLPEIDAFYLMEGNYFIVRDDGSIGKIVDVRCNLFITPFLFKDKVISRIVAGYYRTSLKHHQLLLCIQVVRKKECGQEKYPDR